ncbi:hypothetical protein HJC23_012529 [Cyclotella cryptica]|uniref:Uncharacterized protein n=1 Tax=Cyclotella cryptica TaxID=29204 RepID=A0ABD3QQ43_9STRA
MKGKTMDTHSPRHPIYSPSQQYARRSLSSIPVEDLPPLPFTCGHRPSHYLQCLSYAKHGRPTVDGHSRSTQAGNLSQSNMIKVKSPTLSASSFSYRHVNESPKTPRVSFISSQQNRNFNSNCQQEGQTRVINLPWTDVSGCAAAYTGEVNALIQPHGLGHLQYQNGTVHISVWCNGMPARPPPEIVLSAEEAVRVKTLPERELDLGDIALPSEIQNTSPQEAHDAASSLPVHSFAFVLRSSGQWTYAIVADRPVLTGPDASIRFVINKKGSTKIFKKKHWGMYIRLVRNSNANACDKHVQGEKCDVSGGMRKEQGEKVQTRESFQRLDSFQKAVRRISMDLSIRTKDQWG